MLTEIERRLFVQSAIKAMAAYTLPYLTQVIGVIDDQTGEFRGTGFFCELAGREAIVTADHVRRKAMESGKFQGLAFSRGSATAPSIVAGEIQSFDENSYDLAIYYPSSRFPLGHEKRFWPGDRIGRDPRSILRDYLFVQGFPQRYSRFTTLGGNAIVSETLAYGAMVRYSEADVPSEEREQFDRELPGYEFLSREVLRPHQFALNFWVEPDHFLGPEPGTKMAEDWSEVFEEAEERQSIAPGQKVRGAYGLSGGPVWRLGASGRRSRDWTPEWSEFVGIITGWNASEKVLIATSASKILEVSRG
jgi:hypothetical protein